MDKEITISGRKFTDWLFIMAIGLTATHIVAMLVGYLDLLPINGWSYLPFFDLDENESTGAWFNALTLLTAGQLLLLNALCAC